MPMCIDKNVSVHLWFSRQRWAAIGREVRRDGVQLVVRVLAVQVTVLAVRQNRDQQAIVVGVVHA